jgi:hypothetical protein
MNEPTFALFGKVSRPEYRAWLARQGLLQVRYALQKRYPKLRIVHHGLAPLHIFRKGAFHFIARGSGPRVLMKGRAGTFKSDYRQAVEVVTLKIGDASSLCANPALDIHFHYQVDSDENIFGDWGWHRFQVVDFVDPMEARPRLFHDGVYSYA